MVRDLLLGRTRFKEFSASPEGIPTNILSDRLARLVEAELVIRVPICDGAARHAYRLTKKGTALRPIVRALRDWGLRWEPDTRAELKLAKSRRTSSGR